jgi:hypothetical protein
MGGTLGTRAIAIAGAGGTTHRGPETASPTHTRLIQAIHAEPERARVAKATANGAARPVIRIHRVDTKSCMEASLPTRPRLLW